MTTKVDNKIEGFLFIDNLQTTVRQLNVFSAIILSLNNRQLPKKILEQLLIAWSTNEEQLNPDYKNAKGKLTENGIKTSAIGYYLQISTYLGITTRFNDVYMNTKMSQTFLYFLLTKKEDDIHQLGLAEKIYYLYNILINDADGIIICLSQLINCSGKKQHSLQVEFKEAMNLRLLSKMEIAPTSVKTKLSEKYRTINYVWKSPGKYSEHIIAPRYEWLSNLGLVDIKRVSKDTLYYLSDTGKRLYDSLPIFGDLGIKDITQEWLKNYFFVIANKIFNNKKAELYSNLSVEKQDFELGQSLEKASKAVKSSISFKLPVNETFIFICLDLLSNRNILINFKEIEDKIKNQFSYNSRSYFLKLAGRSNEGYITITLKK